MADEYHLEEMPPEEGIALTKDLQAVLEKYDAEMQVTSTIQLMKRVKNNHEENSNGTDTPNSTNSGERPVDNGGNSGSSAAESRPSA